MFKLFFIIVILKNVFGDDESYEKYIDLLPEEEKQEFLDRIARRILEGIRSEQLNDPNQPNVEITDDQLDAQDAYVQGILKEEAERLENEKKDDDSVRIDEGGEDNGDDNRHIDLTLRDGKRKNGDHDLQLVTTSEIPYNVIPVKTIYDSLNDDPIETANKESKEYLSIRIKHEANESSKVSENNYDPPVHSIKDTLVIQSLNDTKNENNLRKSFQNDVSSTTTDFDQNFDKNSLITDYNVSSASTIQTFKENMNDITNDKVTEETNINSNEKDNLSKDNLDKEFTAIDNIATTSSMIQPRSLYNEESNGEYETTTFTIQGREITTQNDLHNINQQFQRTEVDESISTTETSITDINKVNTLSSVQLTSKLIDILKLNKSDNDKKYIEITENKVELQVTNSSSNFTSVKKSKDFKSITLIKNKDKSEEKLIEPKTGFGLRSGNAEKSNEDIIWIKKIHTNPRREQEYEVFEVAAEKPPFTLLNKVKTNEQPHYVPIYDYAPENAYFRPYDRFGPNFKDVERENLEIDFGRENRLKREDENNFNIPNTRSRFSGYNKKESSQFRINYPIKKGSSKMFGFMKPVQTHFIKNNYYNPYDYFDMDYANQNYGRYILRNVPESNYKPFPDSNEPDHPFNSIHKSDSVKDHIRAVRKLLYLKKMFGYVPEVDKEMRKFDQNAKTFQFPSKKTTEIVTKEPVNDKISMDYYYDRANSREEFGNVQILRGNSSLNKAFVGIPSKKRTGEFNAVLNRNNEKHLNELSQKISDKNKFTSFFDVMLNVLEDMVRFDNEALENYDWLRTSVDIQSAVRKLLDLTEKLKNGKHIHPKDLELLKYCLYIFKSSKVSLHEYVRENKMGSHVKKRKKKGFLPKNRKKSRINQPLVMWRDFAKYIRNNYSESEQKLWILYDFENFLQTILSHLNELHDAIKHIAMITKFDNQKWFADLKQIYFKKATKKQIGKVLLHLSLFILLDRLEEDAVNISKGNFRFFVENNVEAVRRTRNEFVFVFRVLDELNRINV